MAWVPGLTSVVPQANTLLPQPLGNHTVANLTEPAPPFLVAPLAPPAQFTQC